jgi:serine/threonine protein kinase
MADLVNSLLDKYMILRKIGEGGFSKVYHAQCKKTKQDVAIKIIERKNLDSEEAMYVQNEIQILSELDHPNVVKMIEYAETKDQIFIVMELMKGGELFERIIEKEQFTEDEAAEIIRVIADTMRYCHSLGISHRDLKVN